MRKNKKDSNDKTLDSLAGHIPPQNIEIEEVVLGTLMIDKEIIHSCIQEFSPNLFFKIPHIIIAEAILQLYKTNSCIDILTVCQELKRVGKLDEVSPVLVSQLASRVGGTANFEYHFKILQEQSLKRGVIQVCGTAMRKAFQDSEDIFDVFAETQLNLENTIKNVVNYKVVKVGDIHKNIVKQSILIATHGIKSGVASGLTMVDNVTNGWQNTDLIIFAGRPGMGKTAIAISMAMYPAIRENVPIAIFSLEMSSEQLVSRMQSFLSGVNVGRVVKKQLSIQEIEQVDGLAKDLNEAPIYIDDTPNISVMELKGKARKLVRDSGVKLIIIDYLQLMRSGVKTQNREQEIAEISKGLKVIAKDLNVPVIALSQLSRAVESRGGDKKPQLADLRESGQIEQDADMVCFCYRPEYYGIHSYEVGGQHFETNGLFMLLIAKHRNGELGEIPLTFIHELTKVTNHGFSQTFSKPNVADTNINRTFVQHDKSFEDLPKDMFEKSNTADDLLWAGDKLKMDDETPF